MLLGVSMGGVLLGDSWVGRFWWLLGRGASGGSRGGALLGVSGGGCFWGFWKWMLLRVAGAGVLLWVLRVGRFYGFLVGSWDGSLLGDFLGGGHVAANPGHKHGKLV